MRIDAPTAPKAFFKMSKNSEIVSCVKKLSFGATKLLFT
jgi:hypothetical protein